MEKFKKYWIKRAAGFAFMLSVSIGAGAGVGAGVGVVLYRSITEFFLWI